MRYDLIVVGAGPAGASAAYHGARLGLQTLIVDQSTFPRNKPCAGGLTLAAKALLPEELPSSLVQSRISKLTTFYGDRSHTHVSQEPFMEIVRREDFDAWLLTKALLQGASSQLATRVLGYGRDAEGVRLQTSQGNLTCRLLIAADGANSVIARQVRGHHRMRMGFCLQTEVHTSQFDCDTITIHYGLVPEGYGWVFPRQDSALVGVGATLAKVPNPKTYLQAVLRQHGLPSDLQRVQAHVIPIGGQPRPLLGDGVLLAGDAAGLVDPFTGEGIRYALLSGRWAAETAVNALKQVRVPPIDLLAPYAESCRKEINPQLRQAYRLSRTFFRFSGLLHPKLFGREEPVEQLLNVLRGRHSYAQFIRWAFFHWSTM